MKIRRFVTLELRNVTSFVIRNLYVSLYRLHYTVHIKIFSYMVFYVIFFIKHAYCRN